MEREVIINEKSYRLDKEGMKKEHEEFNLVFSEKRHLHYMC
jgi:hypothetical protein